MIIKTPPRKLGKPRKRNRNVESRNADNHAALLAVVGETTATPEVKAHIPRVVVFDELRHLGVLHSRRQVDRLEARDRFPKRVAMGTGRVGWLATEIVRYIDDRIAERSMTTGTLGSDGTVRKPPVRNAPMLGAKAMRKTEAEADAS
jgi:prophage regulatory protein